ncbi:hypothetical protein K491DRAFT_654535 [Lophiostoma macrostomum CBS 122681]|uniref:Uncharacterized protein n=1 Tax=Lophiostoma macrostomum CBS 122681 TaxID=1314788 RepID=A0A6A6TFC8_9PLEO|nr:hypothetical protein K491DRAFT_654535 [Lophiostoma macrostomum CBS 122681]
MAGRSIPRFDPFNEEHTMDLPGADDDFSGIDWNDPASFFNAIGAGSGGLPMPKMISAKEVKKQSKQHSTRILKDWNLLKAILDRHEPTIHRRWLKKTRNQRVALLLAAWPNMPAAHRPDFLAFRKETVSQREQGTKFKEAYMWPCINLEDLSKPKALLLFLQARAQSSPGAFAMADHDAMRLGFVSKAIVATFLNEHTLMFTNRETPETYGELIAWDDHPDAFQWLHMQKGMHPGYGLVVLEVQEKIFGFLVECCKRIMHEIPPAELSGNKYPVQPGTTLTGETLNGFDSLAVMASESPYRKPVSMDLLRLESVIAAKKAAAEDHIWAMREDPGYFSDAVLESRDHRQEMMQDTNGKSHPLLSPGRESVLWYRIIGNLLARAHISLEIWSELLTQVKGLRALQVKYQNEISPDSDLPEEYLNALLTFHHYIKQGAKGTKGELKHVAVASPPLRQFYERTPPRDTNSNMIQVRSRSTKPEKTAAELLWLLRVLWEDGQDLSVIGFTNIVDELGRLIQSETKTKDLLSSYMMDIVSDLSVFSEATRQLNIYQPWAAGFEDALVDKEDELQKAFARRTADWSILMSVLDGPSQAKLIRLGEPNDRKFYYPIDRPRTKESTQSLQSAESNLDSFWSGVDKNMRVRMSENLDRTALGALLSRHRILQRTPDWVEPDRQRKDQKMDIQAITMPLSEIYLDLQQRTERTIDRGERTARAAKVKTRGVAESSSQNANATPQDLSLESATRFLLDARSLKVFRTLFYTPSLTATPGEVPWTDFLHAMVGTGFMPEKLYGSVWQFRPTKLDVERSIQFHEPHPSGKLPYKTARRYGRRLNRAYGWEGNMFVANESGA